MKKEPSVVAPQRIVADDSAGNSELRQGWTAVISYSHQGISVKSTVLEFLEAKKDCKLLVLEKKFRIEDPRHGRRSMSFQ